MTENIFDKFKIYFQELSSNDIFTFFNAVRIKDLGVLKYISDMYPALKIQLILDNGPHNLEGISAFVDLIGERLERVIVSSQLSKDSLISYAKQVKIPLEILVLGRIMLFYTPRKLLSFIEDLRAQRESELEGKYVEANSEESFHNDFQIIENIHGTIMFYPKDLCLLSYVDYFCNNIDLINIRIDLREDNKINLLKDILIYLGRHFDKNDDNYVNNELLENIKRKYKKTVIRGHIEGNKTDLIFKKLKNHHLNASKKQSDSAYIGRVLETEKSNYIVVMIENKNALVKLGDRIKIINPLGKEILFDIKKMEKIDNNQCVEIAKYNDLILLQFSKGVSPGSLVYFSIFL
ncbi:MAG: U32 family peptidase [Oligoflexia bacterium]|nr:U32 family peptidase [Oligoflexia bacterium]